MKAFFLGWTAQYEHRFIAALAGHRPVRHLQPARVLQRAQRKLQSLNKRLMGAPLSDAWLGRLACRLSGAGPQDLLVCNEGQVRRHINPAVVRAFPGRKVLLVRDLVDSAFVAQVRPWFNAIYSFDQQQCAALGVLPLDQFFALGYEEARARRGQGTARRPRTCFFLGRDKHRASTLQALAEGLIANGCEPDFHIVRDDSTEKACAYHVDDLLDYEENLARAQRADVLVEINQPGQSGATLRTLEAAYFGKKLITNNAAVAQLPLYHPNNVFIWKEGSPNGSPKGSPDGFEDGDQGGLAGLGAFLAVPLVPLPDAVLYRYSPDAMLDRLVAEAQGWPCPVKEP